MESRTLHVALRARREPPSADHQLHRWHRDLRWYSRLLPERAHQAMLVLWSDSWDGRGLLWRGRHARAWGSGRAGGDKTLARHDCWLLEGSGALSRDLLVTLAGRLGARGLGLRRFGWFLVHPR